VSSNCITHDTHRNCYDRVPVIIQITLMYVGLSANLFINSHVKANVKVYIHLLQATTLLI